MSKKDYMVKQINNIEDFNIKHLVYQNTQIINELKSLRQEVNEIKDSIKPDFNIVRWRVAADLCGLSVSSFKRKIYRINDNPDSRIYIRIIKGIGINKEDFQDWLKAQEEKPRIIDFQNIASKLINF